MIVRNEEACIEAALKSVRLILGLSDIVVVDTGSSDRTREIAFDNGARVFDFEWVEDFSAARNFAADKAVNDWVLVLDADEEVIEADVDGLGRLIDDAHLVGRIAMIEMSDGKRHLISRLYNRRHNSYDGSIHEQVTPFDGRLLVIKEVPILTIHHGYLPEVKQAKGKHERNIRMLTKALEERPGDPYLLFQLGRSHYNDGGDLSKACYYFEKVLSSGEDVRLDFFFMTVELYGYALINTGQFERALELRDNYSDAYWNDPAFRFLSAHIYQNCGMLIEAVECYESCIGADIDDHRGITSFLSYYNMGVILECVDMLDDAVRMYESCGDYEPALNRLAEIAAGT